MRRRALLTSLGVVPAGCLGVSLPGTDDPTPTSTPVEPCDGPPEPSPDASTDEPEADGEFRLTGLVTSTDTDRPEVRYVLEPSAFYSADAVRRKEERTGEEQVVRDVAAVEDDRARDAIETAIRRGEWRSNELPDGLSGTVDRVDFFTGVSRDGTYTHVGLTLHHLRPDRPPAVAFDARVVDGVVSSESPGAVEFELRNRSRTTQLVSSGTVPPFGMVFAEAVDEPERFLLWREYEDEGCIRFTDDGWTRCDIGITTELEPCARLTRRYEVLPTETGTRPEYTAPPGPGTYRIYDSANYNEAPGAPGSTLSFEVEFTIESTS